MSRLTTGIVFALYTLLMLTVRYWGSYVTALTHSNRPYDENVVLDGEIKVILDLMRLGWTLFVYHAVQAFLLFTVKNSSSPMSILQNNMWLIKIVTLVILTSLSFLVSAKFIMCLYYPQLLIAVLFLMIQAIFLIDSAYAVSEKLADYSEKSTGPPYLQISLALFMGVLLLTSYVFLFMHFQSNLNLTLTILSMVISIAIVSFSLVPKIQNMNESAGLIQPLFVSLHVIYVILTAYVRSNEDIQKFDLYIIYPVYSQVLKTLTFSFLFVFLIRLVTSPGINKGISKRPAESITEIDTASDELEYNYSMLHISLGAAALFLTASITFYSKPCDLAKMIVFDETNLSFWLLITVTWLTPCLYCWSLIAPAVLEERSF